jgi:hypothetical protein
MKSVQTPSLAAHTIALHGPVRVLPAMASNAGAWWPNATAIAVAVFRVGFHAFTIHVSTSNRDSASRIRVQG